MTDVLLAPVLVLGVFSPFLALGWAVERQLRVGCQCHVVSRPRRWLCAFLIQHGRVPYR